MNPPPCPVCQRPLADNGSCAQCGYDKTHVQSLASAGETRSQGTSPVASGIADLPPRLGQYRVVRELGRGGMGRVLEAVDEPLGRQVAVKVLLVPATEKDVRRQRFIEEARIAGGLEHPGIAPIYNLGRAADGAAFFSMKLVTGRNLNDILNERQQGDRALLREYTLARLLSVFERIVETIAYAHSRGILHRDLKPPNVMVGAHGEVWVLDWGLAKVLAHNEPEDDAGAAMAGDSPPLPDQGQGLTAHGALLGTPQYMAPEQARSQQVDVRTDIFGLGGILYKMLTGQAPNQGSDYMGTLMSAALGAIPPVRTTPAGRHAHLALAAIAEKCLAALPENRYATADELLADLRAYLADETVKARPDNWLGTTLRLVRRHHRAALVVGTAAVLLLVTWTVAATNLAAKDRRALRAEREAQAAKLARQAAIADSAARAQRRMRAFEPYAEATDLLMRGQLLDRSTKLLENALGIDPNFPEAQFALGEVRRLNGLPDRAAQAYLRANDLSRQITGRPHLQALLAAGMAYDGAGDYYRSENAFLQAEREGSAHPLALVGKAFRLAHARHLKDARTAAEESLRLAPHLWETQLAAGFVLEELVDLGFVPPEPNRKQAIALLRKAAELSPRQAEVWVWLARSLSRTGLAANRSEALRLFDHALALEPRNGNRYISRGLIRLSVGDGNSALADFQKARALGAFHGLLLYADAVAAVHRRDHETAFRLVGELIRETHDWPPHVGNWLTLGFELGRDQEVRGRFDEWCRNNPAYPEVYALKAQLKARDGDLAGAIAEDRAGLKIAPYNRKLRGHLASHLHMARKWSEALAAADSALEVSPGDFFAPLIRVQCLAELGRGAEAKSLLERLGKDFPTRAKEIEEMRRGLAGRLPK